jgi:CheY-like chemotaxis protein
MPQTGRILVVDDSSDIREVLQALIEIDGYDVDTAEHGLEALNRLQANPAYCLVLLDVMMPVMDGWQVLDLMRKDRRLKDVPVVLVTGDPRVATTAQAPPVQRVLRKPAAPEEILSVVEIACGRAPQAPS